MSNDDGDGGRVLIATFDAVIGAGKTVLVNRATEYYAENADSYGVAKVFAVDEPADEWKSSGMLGEMYLAIARMDARAACGEPMIQTADDAIVSLFQQYAFATRIGKFGPIYRTAKRVADSSDGRDVLLLCERSVYTDRMIFKHMLVAGGYINELQSRVYELAFDAWQLAAERVQPDLAVFLDTPVATAMHRIDVRNRQGEVVPVPYQQRLYARHKELFIDQDVFCHAPVSRIDGMLPYHNDDLALGMIVDKLHADLLQATATATRDRQTSLPLKTRMRQRSPLNASSSADDSA